MNRNERRAYDKAYREKNPDKVRAWQQRWRDKKKANAAPSKPWACPSCGKVFKPHGHGPHKVVCGADISLRFWPRVDKSAGPEACWPWTGSVSTHGYGTLHMLGRYWGAHKAAYFFSHGEVPDGLQIRHTCDNRICCNPTHLLIGTIQDNMNDKKARGRSPKTMRKFLTAEQVRDIRAARGTLSSGDIAKKYGITQSYAFTIWAGKVWRNV